MSWVILEEVVAKACIVIGSGAFGFMGRRYARFVRQVVLSRVTEGPSFLFARCVGHQDDELNHIEAYLQSRQSSFCGDGEAGRQYRDRSAEERLDPYIEVIRERDFQLRDELRLSA